MGMGQGVRTGLGHGGITCVLQTQYFFFNINSFYYFCCCKIGTWRANSQGETSRVRRSVKLWLCLFLTD